MKKNPHRQRPRATRRNEWRALNKARAKGSKRAPWRGFQV